MVSTVIITGIKIEPGTLKKRKIDVTVGPPRWMVIFVPMFASIIDSFLIVW